MEKCRETRLLIKFGVNGSVLKQVHKLVVQSIHGKDIVQNWDNIGTIHVGTHQEISMSQTDLYLPVHTKVYGTGTIILPSTLKILGLSMHVEGTIGGVQDLTMIKSTLELTSTSSTKDSLSDASFTMSSIKVMAGSVLKVTDTDVQFQLVLNSLLVGATGRIEARNLKVTTSTYESEEGGVIDLDKQGLNGESL